jgi:hypothetical protein
MKNYSADYYILGCDTTSSDRLYIALILVAVKTSNFISADEPQQIWAV